MNPDAYFARIGYHGPRPPTLETLRDIARLHPQAIAFENVAVTAGKVPEISIASAEAKLVHARRGGYCYEHNTLLQAVLRELGFRVTGLSARVRFGQPAEYVDSRGHMILRVDLPDGPYLVDAGFGGLTLTAPLALRLNEEQPTPHEPMRLIDANGDFRLQAKLHDGWADLYQFDLSEHLEPDYISQNWYTATRPNAFFRHNLIVTRPVPGGRHALLNRRLTWRPIGAAPEPSELAPDEIPTTLRETFGLTLPEDELKALP